jgi:hypothetical protein
MLVPGTGVEPARLAALDPKSSASANSAIPAFDVGFTDGIVPPEKLCGLQPPISMTPVSSIPAIFLQPIVASSVVRVRTTGHGIAAAMGKLGGFARVFVFPYLLQWRGCKGRNRQLLSRACWALS